MRMSELWADMVYAPTMPSEEDIKRAGEKMLRDQFAIAALTGLVTANYAKEDVDPDDVASWAYGIADAMLRWREAK